MIMLNLPMNIQSYDLNDPALKIYEEYTTSQITCPASMRSIV